MCKARLNLQHNGRREQVTSLLLFPSCASIASARGCRHCGRIRQGKWAHGAAPTFIEFWPHYVLAHRHRVTRGFHFTGTLLGWVLLAAAATLLTAWLVLAALLVPYALAWFSHFFVKPPQNEWVGSQPICQKGRNCK